MLILLTCEPAPRTVPDGGCRENPSLSASQRGDLKSRPGPPPGGRSVRPTPTTEAGRGRLRGTEPGKEGQATLEKGPGSLWQGEGHSRQGKWHRPVWGRDPLRQFGEDRALGGGLAELV